MNRLMLVVLTTSLTTACGSAGARNPASEYCVENGGTLEIRSESKGQYGVCKFGGGTECEEWAFYGGSCKPGDCIKWETCKGDAGAADAIASDVGEQD